MAELLPPAVQAFVVDAAQYLAGIDEMIVANTDLEASITAAIVRLDEMALAAERAATAAAAASSAGVGGAAGAAGAGNTAAADAAAQAQAASAAAARDAAVAQKTLDDAMIAASRSAKIDADAQASLANATKLASNAALADAKAADVQATTAIRTADAQLRQAAAADRAAAANRRSASSSNKAAAGLSKLGKNTLEVAGAFAAYGVKAAGDYQAAIVKLGTSAGESGQLINNQFTGNLKTAYDQILNLSVGTATSTKELTAGMYMVESAGYHIQTGSNHAADGLNVLRVAAQGARAEQAPLASVTSALTTVMRDFGVQPIDAAKAMNVMTVAVGQGKMTMADFSDAIGQVAATANIAHLSFAEVSGAMATLTQHGQTARESVFGLNAVIRNISSPNLQMVKEMERLGVSSVDLSSKLGSRGLVASLEILNNAITSHMGKDGVLLMSVFNTSKTAATNADLAFRTLPSSVQAMATSFKNGTITVKDWSSYLKTLGPVLANQASQWATAEKRATGFSDLLKSGTPLAQSYLQALSKMTGGTNAQRAAVQLLNGNLSETQGNVARTNAAWNAGSGTVQGFAMVTQTFNFKIGQLREEFNKVAITVGSVLIPPLEAAFNWFSKHMGVTKTLAAIVGVVLVAAIVLYTASMIAAAIATVAATWEILLVIAAIALLVAGVMYAWTHFKWFRDAMIATWHAIAASGIWLWDAMKAVWNGLVEGAMWLWHGMETVWHGIVAGATWLWHGIMDVWHAIVAVWHFVADVAMWLWHHVIDPVYQGIVTIHNVMWKVIGPVLHLWMAVMKLVGAIVVIAYRQFIEPAFKGIGLIISWVWDNMIKPMINGTIDAFKKVGSIAMWLWHNQLEPAFKAVGTISMWLWNNAIKPAFDGATSAISGSWDKIRTIFNALVSAADWVGNKISSIFGGIGHMINNVTGGVSSITHMLGFAEGGPVPGMPGAPVAAILHGGEYVLSREMIAKITASGGGGSVGEDVSAFTTQPVVPITGNSGGVPAGGGTGGDTGTNAQIVVVHVYNQGSVIAERDLQRSIQDAVLQMNFRNSNNRYSLPAGR